VNDGNPPQPPDRAEREFSTILHRLENGETFAIDDLCRSHPDLAPELRARYRDWTKHRESTLRDSPTPPSKATGGDGSGTAWREFVERLRSRGATWTRYRFEGEVGRGGMGIVYRVVDVDTRRALALKVLRRPESDDGSPRAPSPDSPASEGKLLGRFLEEARVTAQLDHPNVVPVHELGVDEAGRVYFTMKLVKGDDLKTVFESVAKRRDGWTLPRVIEVLLKVCDAVAYAHAKGVIHRDLKPSNVMVGRYGEVYVMDWGLARVLADPDQRDLRIRARTKVRDTGDASSDIATSESPVVTMDGDVVGTPSYMPPEQADYDAEKLGPWSDVYALGAMIYELLAGHPPYQHGASRRSAYEVLAMVTTGPPPRLASLRPDADPELVAICERAMQRDPTLRYPTTVGLGDDLRAWIEHRVVSVYESGLLAEAKKWVRRNRTLAVTIAVALLAITTLAGFSLRRIEAEKDLALDNERRAVANAEVAEVRRREAELQRTKVEWVLDAVRLDDLEKRWHTAWPAEPGNVDTIRAWIADAEALAKKRAEYANPPSARGAPDHSWWREHGGKLLAELDALEGADAWSPTIASMRARLRDAETIAERSLRGDAAQEWRRARDAVASSNRYGGLDLPLQLGLVPLGFDPRSGLAEFAFLPSGAAPARDPATGTLSIDADSAIVFVLLPGGAFNMGAQKDYPEEPNFDPQAEPSEGPVTPVALAPFFLAKHETTQAQWRRLTGRNPSRWQEGREHPSLERIDGCHPVEQVSHADCELLVQRLGFGVMLPTEAQWEYAARAQTATPWGVPDRRDLPRFANLADLAFRTRGGSDSAPSDPDLDDGFACHAPVGSLEPNGFGLHDTIGNVREWCRDAFSSYDVTPAPGDGERAGPFQDDHVYRGGCFDGLSVHSRCAHRDYKPRTFAADYIGVRFAKRIDSAP
jgi:serine/threonine protein kinase/formylglycine-generating enzyme required for sulfatase activity